MPFGQWTDCQAAVVIEEPLQPGLEAMRFDAKKIPQEAEEFQKLSSAIGPLCRFFIHPHD